MYAQVTNNEITRINLQYPFSIPGVSLPRNPDPAFLATMGYFPMVGDAPVYDPATQRLTGPIYEVDGETIKRVYAVEDIPMEELTASFIRSVEEATQTRLDDFAKTKGYDGIISACSYATSDSKYGTEGRYCVSAREATWDALFQLMADVQTGTKPMPGSVEEVMQTLPTLEWPVV